MDIVLIKFRFIKHKLHVIAFIMSRILNYFLLIYYLISFETLKIFKIIKLIIYLLQI